MHLSAMCELCDAQISHSKLLRPARLAGVLNVNVTLRRADIPLQALVAGGPRGCPGHQCPVRHCSARRQPTNEGGRPRNPPRVANVR